MADVMLLTGGSQGIGAAILRAAAARGYRVAFTYRENQAMAEAQATAVAAAGGQALPIRAEMASEPDILAAFAATDRTFGPVSVLVNNAGITGPTARLDAVTVRGPFLAIREATRRMATDLGGAGGAIVNVSSRAAELGGAGEWVHYAASKGALDSLTIGAARELGPRGIRVNAVSPGLIETDLHARAGLPDRVARLTAGVPMGRAGLVEEVAEAVMFLASPAASYISGAILPISGAR
jgi:NAD(P)-dependent dehydrogenase (short-subunit alcohol dehydrogenase family)